MHVEDEGKAGQRPLATFGTFLIHHSFRIYAFEVFIQFSDWIKRCSVSLKVKLSGINFIYFLKTSEANVFKAINRYWWKSIYFVFLNGAFMKKNVFGSILYCPIRQRRAIATKQNFPSKLHYYVFLFFLSNRKHLMGLSNLLTSPSLNYSIPEKKCLL